MNVSSGYLKHLPLRTLIKEQVLLVERLQGLSCNLGFLFGFTCTVIQQVHLDIGSWEGRKEKRKADGREEADLLKTQLKCWCGTWEGFGARFGGKASCPDHLHLQLAFLVHQTDLNITCRRHSM